MIIDASVISLLVSEILLYLFHLSVLILLIVKRKFPFNGSFYNIFRFVLAADLCAFICLALIQKLSLVPFVYDFYKTADIIASILSQTSSFMTIVQFFGHLLMAFNRFTLIWFPLKQKMIWSRQWYTVLLIAFGMIHVLWKIGFPVVFVFNPNTYVGFTYVDKDMVNFYYIVTTVIFMVTTFLCALLNILTFAQFFCRKSQSINVKEKSLLFVSLVIFLVQVLRTSYNVSRLFFPSNQILTAFFQSIVLVLYDIFAWSGSLSLLILSSTTRKEYIKFYFNRHKSSSLTTTGITIFSKYT